MTIRIGDTARDSFYLATASQTWTRIHSRVAGEDVTWNPDLTEVADGAWEASYDVDAEGTWLWWGQATDGSVWSIEWEVASASSAEVMVTSAGGTWTYAADFDDPMQAVRHVIGDTDSSDPKLTDAEITYELGLVADDVTMAAIACCRRLMARYAALADTTELDLSVKASQLFDHYKSLAETLQAGVTFQLLKTAREGAVPYAGGISYADVGTRQANQDRVPSRFERTAADDYGRRHW